MLIPGSASPPLPPPLPTTRWRRLLATVAATALAISAASYSLPAHAKSKALRAFWASDVRLDGLPNEHSGDWRELTEALKGHADSADDFQAKALISYDDSGLFIAADVRDDKLVGGGDHLELLLGIPGGSMQSFLLYPGVPGKSRASVKLAGGGPVRGAKIVEAPADGGYTLEAFIPWSAVSRSSTVRIGYRGALFAHDADSSTRVKTSLGTIGSRRYADLPALSTEPELALGSGLLRERNIRSAPSYNLLADVAGDKLLERVLVYDQFLVVLGPGYRAGREYFYRDLGTAGGGELLKFSLKDYTGDRKADVMTRRRVRFEGGSVEVLQVLSYDKGGDTPAVVLDQEIGLSLDDGGRIDNDVRIRGSGAGTRVLIRPGRAQGVDQRGFRYQPSGESKALLLPWGSIGSRSYGVRGGRFEVLEEKTQSVDRPPPPPPPRSQQTAPPSPRQASRHSVKPASAPAPTSAITQTGSKSGDGAAMVERVYELYKSKHHITGPARFDLRADLTEDSRAERLVVHDRALVLFGEGYRDGRSYTAIDMTNFARASDILSVRTRDASGDGKHEIVVTGVIRSPLPAEVGNGDMLREVVMIYKVIGGQLARVMAAEIKRSIGDKYVMAKLSFSSAGGIDLSPDRASGYDESSYPWAQKTSSDNGFEPLLLPWGGIAKVALRFDGHSFVRR